MADGKSELLEKIDDLVAKGYEVTFHPGGYAYKTLRLSKMVDEELVKVDQALFDDHETDHYICKMLDTMLNMIIEQIGPNK